MVGVFTAKRIITKLATKLRSRLLWPDLRVYEWMWHILGIHLRANSQLTGRLYVTYEVRQKGNSFGLYRKHLIGSMYKQTNTWEQSAFAVEDLSHWWVEKHVLNKVSIKPKASKLCKMGTQNIQVTLGEPNCEEKVTLISQYRAYRISILVTKLSPWRIQCSKSQRGSSAGQLSHAAGINIGYSCIHGAQSSTQLEPRPVCITPDFAANKMFIGRTCDIPWCKNRGLFFRWEFQDR